MAANEAKRQAGQQRRRRLPAHQPPPVPGGSKKRLAASLLLLLALPLTDRTAEAASVRGSVSSSRQRRTPVVLVNGLAGSALEAKLEGAQATEPYCQTDADWYLLWLSVREVLPPGVQCLTERLLPIYRPQDNTWYNQPGVSIRARDFGGLDGLAYLDPDLQVSATVYMAHLIEHLTDSLGYTPGLDLFGAPFDWRLSPSGLRQTGYYTELQALVSKAVALSDGTPVAIITHSMGGPVVLDWLSSAAADKEGGGLGVGLFVPIASPFGGAVSTLQAVVSGDNFGVPGLPDDYFRPIQANCASGPYLLPRPELWPTDEVLVRTPSASYSAWDLLPLMQQLGLNQTAAAYPAVAQETLSEAGGFSKGPGVPTHHIYGYGTATLSSLAYPSDFLPTIGQVPPPPTQKDYEDGDGTVNLRSLQRPEAVWEVLTPHPLPNATHFGLLSDPRVFDLLTTLLLQPEGGQASSSGGAALVTSQGQVALVEEEPS